MQTMDDNTDNNAAAQATGNDADSGDTAANVNAAMKTTM